MEISGGFGSYAKNRIRIVSGVRLFIGETGGRFIDLKRNRLAKTDSLLERLES
jgi:hypothetical protein